MKKFTLLVSLMIFSAVITASAQIEQGNIFIGSDISNLNLGLNKPSTFSALVNPKAAWFIHDNIAIGGYGLFGITTTAGEGSNINYGIGPLGRYYEGSDVSVLQHGRFFAEATAGLGGQSVSKGGSTNGLNISFGPGLAYFVTTTVGLEVLLKYQGVLGFGSTAYQNNLTFGFGFQVYLPGSSTAKKVSGDIK